MRTSCLVFARPQAMYFPCIIFIKVSSVPVEPMTSSYAFRRIQGPKKG